MNKATTVEHMVRLSEYQAPDFAIDSVNLTFDLGEGHTVVTSRMEMQKCSSLAASLALHGGNLELISITLDGKKLVPKDYELSPHSLTILQVPQKFVLEITTKIFPEKNIALEGLYKSSGNFCTQCEAQGFRHITFYLDRPDVMSIFTTRIIANKEKYPVLLSNGNLVESGEMANGTHFAVWHDPFKKPSYLFALVAGKLAEVEDFFVTKSGRKVALKFYVEYGNENSCQHAVDSLKRAMKWDEDTFGLEYDLDVYMVVAVSDFNMGAMENKGLNIFNTKYVLADADVATDGDLKGIEGVIGHEYFHNWTGNRVTCRDWFQLSLKEGLTVFRDQEFSADMNSRAVKRIEDVRILRAAQFIEDKGPFAHPVRPEAYQKIDNFYTSTVYNKGAEVIRMMHTLLGAARFRSGMDLYFARHDGQAVTCDDFAKAMEDANKVDFTLFKRWYSQAGTPVLDIDGFFDKESQTFSLAIRQSCPLTPGQETKEPFHIPLRVALIGKDGLELEETARVLEVKHENEMFIFGGIEEKPVPSLLRGFSAPITLNYNYSDEELLHLLMYDSDSFNRWEAGQRVATNIMLRMVAAILAGKDYRIPKKFIDSLSQVLKDDQTDPELVALTLILPSESFIGDKMDVVEVDAIYLARRQLKTTLAKKLKGDFERIYHANALAEVNSGDGGAKFRALKNVCLGYLSVLGTPEYRSLCAQQFNTESNMTNRIAALSCLVEFEGVVVDDALAQYFTEFSENALAMDKWFSVQALSSRGDTLEKVKALESNPKFSLSNPNKVRALIGAFCAGNIVNFHAESGEGYAFLAEHVIKIDSFNPQIAARMVSPLCDWRRYNSHRQKLMTAALKKIQGTAGLSANTAEIVGKSLRQGY